MMTKSVIKALGDRLKGVNKSRAAEYCLSEQSEVPQGNPNFVKGNKLCSKANLTPEQHQKRMEALMRGWQTSARKRRGERVVTAETKKRTRIRKRIRLRETVAKEAREIQEIARQRAVSAMNRLAEIIDNPASKDSDAIAAIAVTLDRAYGKATQTNVNANLDANGQNKDISATELNQRIEKALKRVAELTGGKPEAPPSKDRPADLRKRNPDTGSSSVH